MGTGLRVIILIRLILFDEGGEEVMMYLLYSVGAVYTWSMSMADVNQHEDMRHSFAM